MPCLATETDSPRPERTMNRSEHIAALYREGFSQRMIARQIEISQPAVRKRLLKLGLLPPRRVSAEQAITLAPLHDNVLSAQAEGVGLNIPPQQIQPLKQPIHHHGSDNHPRLGPREEDSRDQQEGYHPVTSSQQALQSEVCCCKWCRGWFRPRHIGQIYCCDICGIKGSGLQPAVPNLHATGCTLLSDN